MRTLITITAVAAVAALAGPAAALATSGRPPATRVTADFHSCGYYPTGPVHLRSGPGTRYLTPPCRDPPRMPSARSVE